MLDYFQNLIANCASKWRPVVGYEGLYDVSTDGHVRSLSRTVITKHYKNGRVINGKILSPVIMNGYPVVSLYGKSRKPKIKYVHRLIVEANIGRIPDGHEVDHIDGDRSNSVIGNLRIATYLQNVRNKINTGMSDGHRGVSFYKGKWRAKIYTKNKCKQVGSFATEAEAVKARLQAESEQWGDDAPSVVRS